jgi:hypothetical protein
VFQKRKTLSWLRGGQVTCLSLDVVDGVGRLHLEGDGLAGDCAYAGSGGRGKGRSGGCVEGEQ